MKRPVTFLPMVVLLVCTACGVGTDPAKPRIQDIRILKQAEIAGCEFRGMVADDDMEDLLGKARKVYGNTVVLKNGAQGKYVSAEVYRCPGR